MPTGVAPPSRPEGRRRLVVADTIAPAQRVREGSAMDQADAPHRPTLPPLPTAPTGHGGGHPRRPPPSRRPPLPHLGNFASSPPRPLPHPCPCPLTAAAGRQSSPLGGAIGHWPWWPALATRRLDVGGQSNPAGRRATRARPPFPPAHPPPPRYPPGRPRPGAAAWCARWPRDRAASRREHAVASTCGTHTCVIPEAWGNRSEGVKIGCLLDHLPQLNVKSIESFGMCRNSLNNDGD